MSECRAVAGTMRGDDLLISNNIFAVRIKSFSRVVGTERDFDWCSVT